MDMFINCISCVQHVNPAEFDHAVHTKLWDDLLEHEGKEISIGWHGCALKRCENDVLRKILNDVGVAI